MFYSIFTEKIVLVMSDIPQYETKQNLDDLLMQFVNHILDPFLCWTVNWTACSEHLYTTPVDAHHTLQYCIRGCVNLLVFLYVWRYSGGLRMVWEFEYVVGDQMTVREIHDVVWGRMFIMAKMQPFSQSINYGT